ncbi:hypothetical protein [Chitinimonas koreensis]|uniref:hypothetical protein n=1 Tax=Chitinimonas koreensis TaxID=356302 RepID=UPI000428C2E1|nr:hypothetical protein [Chitinimonas koreensis]QNM97325.1 hypothetical protein H9L41_03140 [Chitinimonas koreensis]
MPRLLYLGLLAAALLPLGGCAGFASPAGSQALEPGKPYWFNYTAERRGALLLPAGSAIKTCSEPSPDTSMNVVSQLDLSAGLKNGADVGVQQQTNLEVVQLARRSQTIQFLRESLFRLCELSLNNALTPQQVTDQYAEVVKIASQLAQSEADSARASADNATARKLEAQRHLQGTVDNTGGAIDAAAGQGK